MKLSWNPCPNGEYVSFTGDGISLRLEVRKTPDMLGGASWSWVMRMVHCSVASGYYLPTLAVARQEAEAEFEKFLGFWKKVGEELQNEG